MQSNSGLSADMDIFPTDDEELDVNLPTVHIPDNIVKTRAKASLPSLLSTSEGDNNCVTSKSLIQKGTQFGPLCAPFTSYDIASGSPFLMKVPMTFHSNSLQRSEACYYDTKDENQCNWMCLVRPALVSGEQNLAACIKNKRVFFLTIKDIQPMEELKVWYSKQYAHFMEKPHLTSSIPTTDESPSGSKRLRGMKTPTFFPYFEDEDINEAEVRNVPPKKRGWRRANMKLVKEPSQKNQSTSSSSLNDKSSSEQPLGDQELTQRLDAILNEDETKWNSQSHALYRCCICGKGFKRKHSLTIHSVVHSETMRFLCHTCGKRFKRKDKLRDHFKRMHLSKEHNTEGDDIGIPKTIVNRRFQTKSCATAAVFKCQSCSVAFRRRGMLVNHISKKHPGIDLNSVVELSQPLLKRSVSFVCPYCKKSYKSVSKRSAHIKKHHPGQSVPPGLRDGKRNSVSSNSHVACNELKEIKPFQCPYCPSQYSSNNKLCRHMTMKHQHLLKPRPQNRKAETSHLQGTGIEIIPNFSAADVTSAFEDVLETPTLPVDCPNNLFEDQEATNVLEQCMEEQAVEQVGGDNSTGFQVQLEFSSRPTIVSLPTNDQRNHDHMQFVPKVDQPLSHVINHTEKNNFRPRKHHLLQAKNYNNPKVVESGLQATAGYAQHRLDPEAQRHPHYPIILEQSKTNLSNSYPSQNGNVEQLQTSPPHWNYSYNIEYPNIHDVK